uniref:Uncharacterized protein n=1 Tax=Corvus moneduloides TaxID=1196302 RepID=A0A8U7MY18_CORMO
GRRRAPLRAPRGRGRPRPGHRHEDRDRQRDWERVRHRDRHWNRKRKRHQDSDLDRDRDQHRHRDWHWDRNYGREQDCDQDRHWDRDQDRHGDTNRDWHRHRGQHQDWSHPAQCTPLPQPPGRCLPHSYPLDAAGPGVTSLPGSPRKGLEGQVRLEGSPGWGLEAKELLTAQGSPREGPRMPQRVLVPSYPWGRLWYIQPMELEKLGEGIPDLRDLSWERCFKLPHLLLLMCASTGWGFQLDTRSFGRGPWVLGVLEAADLAPSSRAGAVYLRLLRLGLAGPRDLPRQDECLSCS